ncbi:hypothetical protein NIE32_12815, partial [Sporolactobacillus kofuensis]|uniref:hypothetical protein n=1 Tax=Sporolactobacillus kofuensis TaxID=269672 RepID=UPI0020980D2B
PSKPWVMGSNPFWDIQKSLDIKGFFLLRKIIIIINKTSLGQVWGNILFFKQNLGHITPPTSVY